MSSHDDGTQSLPTTSFHIDGDVKDSVFEDIDSTADTVIKAGKLRESSFKRIRHHPNAMGDAGVNWAMVGALASVAGVVAVVLIAILT